MLTVIHTERPVTVTEGTNRLSSVERLVLDVEAALSEDYRKSTAPALWDGHTARRVLENIKERVGGFEGG